MNESWLAGMSAMHHGTCQATSKSPSEGDFVHSYHLCWSCFMPIPRPYGAKRSPLRVPPSPAKDYTKMCWVSRHWFLVTPSHVCSFSPYAVRGVEVSSVIIVVLVPLECCELLCVVQSHCCQTVFFYLECCKGYGIAQSCLVMGTRRSRTLIPGSSMSWVILSLSVRVISPTRSLPMQSRAFVVSQAARFYLHFYRHQCV